jgi:hypothetical protein
VDAAAQARAPSANKKNEDIVTAFDHSRHHARRSRIACCGVTLPPRRMPHPYGYRTTIPTFRNEPNLDQKSYDGTNH